MVHAGEEAVHLFGLRGGGWKWIEGLNGELVCVWM